MVVARNVVPSPGEGDVVAEDVVAPKAKGADVAEGPADTRDEAGVLP